jgi:RimJ/RimL family protein N-acetyltransferase
VTRLAAPAAAGKAGGMESPILETERLILRRPEAQDFDNWAEFCADPASMRFLGGEMARGAAWRNMIMFSGAWLIQGFGYFSVIEKATGEWVGRVGPWFPDGWPDREVGWGILRSRTGRGYAAEAATAALDYAFDALGWERVIHVIHPENTPSQGVARSLGSTLLGPVALPAPLEAWPSEAWGQTREAWRTRRQALRR